MNKNQVEYFRAVLNQRLGELTQNANHAISEFVSQNSQGLEIVDRASFDTNQILQFRIRSRENRLTKKIQAALERIGNNTYGICESCGEDISIKRLEARPVTTKCINCKKEEEKQELLAQ
jgi:DnaK suppressor protein